MERAPCSPPTRSPAEARQPPLAGVLDDIAQAVHDHLAVYRQDLRQIQAVVSDAFQTVHRLLDQHGLAGAEPAARALQFEDIASQLVARAQAAVTSLGAYADELGRQRTRLLGAGPCCQAAEARLAEAAAALADTRRGLRLVDQGAVRQQSVSEGDAILFERTGA